MKKSAAVVAGVILALGVAAPAFADADATGVAVGSPGVLSGNVIQFPIDMPVNFCGNVLGAADLLSPTLGTTCLNH